ncbi:MAG: hypothetical protein ISS31_04495 [Kiritimatiellae bacterium]|nr:hypothetical protein [Kiritimatiellia bacterium]
MEFYINEYLLYSEAVPAAEGATHIHGFFGDWFVRKAMWASETSIKRTAAGLKKFYQFLFDTGRCEIHDVQFVRDMVREDVAEWLAGLRRYNSAGNDVG